MWPQQLSGCEWMKRGISFEWIIIIKLFVRFILHALICITKHFFIPTLAVFQQYYKKKIYTPFTFFIKKNYVNNFPLIIFQTSKRTFFFSKSLRLYLFKIHDGVFVFTHKKLNQTGDDEKKVGKTECRFVFLFSLLLFPPKKNPIISQMSELTISIVYYLIEFQTLSTNFLSNAIPFTFLLFFMKIQQKNNYSLQKRL